MKVAFKLVREHDEAIVKFQVSDVTIPCEDGTEEEGGTFRIRRAELRDRGTFFERVIYYGSSAHSTDEEFYWFRGRIYDRGRRAKGFIATLYDPYDPPGEADLPECSTDGKYHWVAQRVR